MTADSTAAASQPQEGNVLPVRLGGPGDQPRQRRSADGAPVADVLLSLRGSPSTSVRHRARPTSTSTSCGTRYRADRRQRRRQVDTDQGDRPVSTARPRRDLLERRSASAFAPPRRHPARRGHRLPDLRLCDNLDIVANMFLGVEIRRQPPVDETPWSLKAKGRCRLPSVTSVRSSANRFGSLSGGSVQSVRRGLAP